MTSFIYYKKSFFFILVFGLFFVALSKICREATDGFSISRILPPKEGVVFKNTILSEKEKKEIHKLLCQKYTYLGCGGQFYVFSSEDGTTVLKLFKFHHLRAPTWKKWVPKNPWMKKNYSQMKASKEKVKAGLFASLQIASMRFKRESGLIYAHVEPTTILKHKIVLFDKLHNKFFLDADTTCFVLQKKGIVASLYLKDLVEKKQIEKAHKALDSLLTFSLSRSKCGIRDLDFKFRSNLGFYEDEPMQLDLGSLSLYEEKDSLEIFNKDLKKAHHKFNKWLTKHLPSLIDYFYAICHHSELIHEK